MSKKVKSTENNANTVAELLNAGASTPVPSSKKSSKAKLSDKDKEEQEEALMAEELPAEEEVLAQADAEVVASEGLLMAAADSYAIEGSLLGADGSAGFKLASAAGADTAATSGGAAVSNGATAMSALGGISWGAVGAVAVGVAAVASGGGGGVASTVFTIGLALGPTTDDGAGTTITLYRADGTPLEGEGTWADGKYTFTASPAYTGKVFIKVTDEDATPDYIDEATGQGKDIGGSLMAATEISSANVSVTVTPITTLAAMKAVGASSMDDLASKITNGEGADANIAATNQAVATLFGLSTGTDLAQQTPELAITSGGNASTPDAYGRALAAISTFEVNQGVTPQQAIANLAAAIQFNGTTASLSVGATTTALQTAAAAPKVTIGDAETTLPSVTAITQAVTVADNAAPVFTSAAVNAAGTTLTLTYGEALDATNTPVANNFVVNVAGASRAVSDVSVSGSTVVLTLATPVFSGQEVTVGYTDPTADNNANAIQDTAGNDAATLVSTTSVTNSSIVAVPTSSDQPGSIAVTGTATQGEVLTAGTVTDADGNVTGTTYQWKADGVNISGATSSTYTLTQAEVGKAITVVATYTDGHGPNKSVTSAATSAVANIDDVGSIAAISGTVEQGQTLTAGSITDADGSISNITYQWKADGTDISGATSNTYTLTQAEVGKAITVVATYTDGHGPNKSATSTATGAVANIDDVGSIAAISGTVEQGQTLTAGSITDADGSISNITYQWKADGTDISGATSNTYTLTQAEVGKAITVVATYTDGHGPNKSATSTATGAVANIDDAGSIGAITGTATQGEVLTAGTVTDADGSITGTTYQWKADGVNISGATSSTYTLTQAEVGKAITVVATYTDGHGPNKTATSAETSAVVALGDQPGSIAVTGTATQGEVLTAGNVTDADGNVTGTTYQWKADGVNISGATSNTYTLTQAEVGKAITVVATYTDGHGPNKSVTSAATSAVANIDDVGSIAAISGTVEQGQTLTAGSITDADGSITGTTYQWKADGVNISGATSSTYTLTQAEVGKAITVVATYTDGHGPNKSATSTATGAVANIDDVGSIAVTGTATQGQVLTAGSITDADGSITGTTYQWKADGVNISGATSSTYTLTQAEVGKAITVVATYTDGHGPNKSATSTATGAVANIDDAGSIGAITGTATQGQVLTAGSITDADGSITGTTYQWKADGVNISGATSSTYTLTQAEVGKAITVVATYTDGHGPNKSATSTATGAVANIDDAGSIGAITGTATQGQVLTAGSITDADGSITGTTYQWKADGVNISGATSSTYTLTQAEVGKAITVVATYTDGHGPNKSATSTATGAVANIDDAGSIGAITGTATQGQVLTAGSITDADGSITGTTYQWKADGVNISGATSSTYTLTQAEVGKAITVVATYTDGHGPNKSATSTATGAVANIDDAGSIGAITGTATQGQVLTAGSITDADGSISNITYQWKADGVNISGATSSTYTLTQAEVGKAITVVATYTDGHGPNKSATSTATGAVTNIDDVGSIAAISGTVEQGQTLTAGSITDADGSISNITYQWKADGVNISGATSSTYTLTQAEVGKAITVVATYSDEHGPNKSVTSTATSQVTDTTPPTPALTTGAGPNTGSAVVQSSETGTAYLVKTGGTNPVTVSDLASITNAPDAKWNNVSITTANSGTNLSLAGLEDGTYSLYTLDEAGNLSSASNDTYTVDTTAPVFTSAAVSTDGTTLTLTYGEALSATTATTGAFAVSVEGASRTVNSVSVSGSTVVLTLATPVFSGEAVTVGYNDPSVNNDLSAIQDGVGNDAVTITGQLVTNNSTAAVVPVISAVAITGATVNEAGGFNKVIDTGDVITAEVTMSENVSVTGAGMTLGLTIGSQIRQAVFDSVSDNKLVFKYTVVDADIDHNGVSIAQNALTLNGATITDAATNAAASITHAAVADNSSYLVDAFTVTGVSGTFIGGYQVEGNWYFQRTTGAEQNAVHTSTDYSSYSVLAGAQTATGVGLGSQSIGFGLATLGATSVARNANTILTGTATNTNTVTNTTYDGLAAVWDASNGAGVASGGYGFVPNWIYQTNSDFWTNQANSSGVGINLFRMGTGRISGGDGATWPASSVYTVFSAAPNIAAITGNDIINASEQGATITGTNEAGATVTLTIGGNTRAATVSGTTWSYTLVAGDISAMGEGAETISVTQTDAAGNVSLAATRSFTVDLTRPAQPTIQAIAGDNTIRIDEQNAVITGTNEAGATVALSIGGNTRAATVSGTTWSYTLVAGDISAMGEGAETISVTQTDAAGNVSQATPRAIWVDTQAPEAPTIDTIATDDSISPSEQSAVITGTNEAGATVALSIGGNTRAATVSGTTWSYTLVAADITAMGQGANKIISVTQTDAAGNVSPAATRPITVSTVVAGAPTINAIATDDIIKDSEQGAVISGTNEAGATVALSIGGNTRAASMDGTTWSYTLVAGDITAMDQGAETISVTQTVAGNTSGATTRAIMVDTLAPTISGVAITGATVNEAGGFNKVIDTGDVITAEVTMSENVSVTGTGMTLGLTIGSQARQAVFDRVSGNKLVFKYTVVDADIDHNGVSIAQNALTLNGATITDAATNAAANVTHAAVGSNSNYLVDAFTVTGVDGTFVGGYQVEGNWYFQRTTGAEENLAFITSLSTTYSELAGTQTATGVGLDSQSIEFGLATLGTTPVARNANRTLTGTTINTNTVTNTTYDGLAAVWDASNGAGVASGGYGFVPNWIYQTNSDFWTDQANASGVGINLLRIGTGRISGGDAETWSAMSVYTVI